MIEQNEGINKREGKERDVERIADLLDRSLDDLPPRVNARLETARRKALEAGEGRRPPAYVGVWAGGLAASLLLAVSLLLMAPDEPLLGDEPQTMLFAMAEMDDLDWALVQDLEFAYWLSEPNNALQSPSSPPSDNRSG